MSIVPVIVPISELRQDAAGLFKRVVASDEPVFVTQRGRSSVVIQSTHAYERVQHENEILRMLVQGDVDIAAGAGRDAEVVLVEARALPSDAAALGPSGAAFRGWPTDCM